nr:hypothetical protein [uncultured Campylobacter sp.]
MTSLCGRYGVRVNLIRLIVAIGAPYRQILIAQQADGRRAAIAAARDKILYAAKQRAQRKASVP